MKDVYIICEVDELFAGMDESLAHLNKLLGSKYLKE